MKFKLRVIRPKESKWSEIEAANLEDAVQTYHCDGVPDNLPNLSFRNEFEPGSSERIYFSVVEVAEHGNFFARTFWRGMTRKGGVKAPHEYDNGLRRGSLEWIARGLEWDREAKELLAPWTGEETWDDASARSTG